MPTDNSWLGKVEREIKRFASRFASVYVLRERQIAAAFEVGCFLALVRYYEKQGCTCTPQNLKAGEYNIGTSRLRTGTHPTSRTS